MKNLVRYKKKKMTRINFNHASTKLKLKQYLVIKRNVSNGKFLNFQLQIRQNCIISAESRTR